MLLSNIPLWNPLLVLYMTQTCVSERSHTDLHRLILSPTASELFPSSTASLWASTCSPSCLQEHHVSTMSPPRYTHACFDSSSLHRRSSCNPGARRGLSKCHWRHRGELMTFLLGQRRWQKMRKHFMRKNSDCSCFGQKHVRSGISAWWIVPFKITPVIKPPDTKTGSQKTKATKHNKNKVNGMGLWEGCNY